jgi:hypothetical protein
MRRVTIAEQILTPFAGRERAAGIAGDLSESAQTRGTAWFWRNVASAVMGLGWPIAAAFVACLAMEASISAAGGAVMNGIARANHGRALPPAGPALLFSAMLVSGLGIYAGFRYGLRDRMTRLAAGITLIAFVGACLQQTRFVPLIAGVIMLALMIVSARSREGRRALGVLVVAYLVSAIAFVGVVMANNRPAVLLGFPWNYMLIIATQWLICRVMRPATA